MFSSEFRGIMSFKGTFVFYWLRDGWKNYPNLILSRLDWNIKLKEKKEKMALFLVVYFIVVADYFYIFFLEISGHFA